MTRNSPQEPLARSRQSDGVKTPKPDSSQAPAATTHEIPWKFKDWLLTTSSTSAVQRQAAILQLQRLVGNQAVQRMQGSGSVLQRDPVDTAYGQYDSQVLEQQQQQVQQLLGKLEDLGKNGLPKYGESPGGFRAYTGLDTFPTERETPKRPREQQHYQGWKVHVGVKPDEAARLAEAILPIAEKYQVVHKIVAQLMTYAMDKDPNQLGKYITIYPKDIRQLFAIVAEIEGALMRLNLTRLAPTERTQSEYPLGTSGLVTTRYGSFTGKQVYVPGNEGQPGQFVADDRSKAHPEGLEKEFAEIRARNEGLVQELTALREQMRQGQLEKQALRKERGKAGIWK